MKGEILPGFDSDEVLRASEQARGIHTAERFFALEPEKATKVAEFVRDGAMSGAEIARVCHCSRNTVAAVRRKMYAAGVVSVEQLNKGRAAAWADVEAQSKDRILEIFADPEQRAKVSAKDAAIIAGISAEKLALTTGQATARVEIVGADLAEIERLIEAEVIETHLAEGVEGEKGGSLAKVEAIGSGEAKGLESGSNEGTPDA